jgi:hypothetical protein
MGDEIRVSKAALASLPGDYEETRLGDPRGAKRQYRSSSGVHIREYEDEYAIHVDLVDPRRDPLGHLLRDSPESLLAVGAGLLAANGAAAAATRCLPGRSRNRVPAGLLGFVLAFLAVNTLARSFKRLFVG